MYGHSRVTRRPNKNKTELMDTFQIVQLVGEKVFRNKERMDRNESRPLQDKVETLLEFKKSKVQSE